MAKKDIVLENEGSAGKFERFLFLMIPIIFTLVLLGVLLTLFNMDIRNNVLQIANKIPVVEKWVPDPAADQATDLQQQTEKQAESSDTTIKQLKAELAKQEASLKKVAEEKTAQDTQVKSLQSQVEKMKTEAAAAAVAVTAEAADDSYQKEVTDLAKLYAGMKASNAALIMANLTTEELVQIFSVMNTANKTAILEKMDPKLAAEVSIKLKETTTSTDMAIAALQSRLKKDATTKTTTGTSTNLDKATLVQTFTTMSAADAALLLGEMYKISPDKVITILNSVSDSVRSSILGAMTNADSVQTAKVVNRLMGGK